MAISIDWGTKIITVPQADLTALGGGVYQLDLDWFRLQLKDLEDSEDGIYADDTHRHNTTVLIGGATLARVVEIINGYTVTFEDGQYAVNLVGANSNIIDVANFNQVSIRSNNSAGLISAVTAADVWSYSGSRSLSAVGNQAVVDELKSTTFDGRTFADILPDLLAMAAGRIVEGPDGVFKFYERDDTTVRYTLTKTGNQRLRS